MTLTTFIILLYAFSAISALVTEGIKTLLPDNPHMPCNLMALIVALLVGGIGCAIYYRLNGIPFHTDNVIYMLLMGFASGVTSMVGYDKVKQCIEQLTGK